MSEGEMGYYEQLLEGAPSELRDMLHRAMDEAVFRYERNLGGPRLDDTSGEAFDEIASVLRTMGAGIIIVSDGAKLAATFVREDRERVVFVCQVEETNEDQESLLKVEVSIGEQPGEDFVFTLTRDEDGSLKACQMGDDDSATSLTVGETIREFMGAYIS